MPLVLLALLTLIQGSPSTTVVSHYERGMELWREGDPAAALRHLMSATLDPDVSFYAARQASLMGEFALPVLYRGLWHEDENIQRHSAIIIGWIGGRKSIEPLLFRMNYPDAPLETEYALRKIGGLTGPEVFTLLNEIPLGNPALLDRKVSGFIRLSQAFRLPLDPAPLLAVVEAIETDGAEVLEEDPYGHAANARTNLLLFMAERRISKAAAPLVRALTPGADEANLAIADALIQTGSPSLEPLVVAFRAPSDESLRVLLAVTHYFAAGASEASMEGPIAFILNELQSQPELARETARLAARFSRTPNPLLLWFTHHPDPEVRKALAPASLDAPEMRARPELESFYLEKTRDPDPEVAAAHLRVVSKYLPDPDAESRLGEILGSTQEPGVLREVALEAVVHGGPTHLLLKVLRTPEDPLRIPAVKLSVARPEPEVISSLLDLIREPEPSAAKREAIAVVAEEWRRPEATLPLLGLLRTGDVLWREAARGLAALGVAEAADPFVALIDSGRTIDLEEASALYFAFTGIPARLVGSGPGTFRFVPLALEERPPHGKVFIVVREMSDYRGWVKVEERWEGERLFHLDEGRGELILYDRKLFEQVEAGAGILLLEQKVRQTVLNTLELSETRQQTARALEALPDVPLAGLEGDELRLFHRGHWVSVAQGRDLREESVGTEGWGRSALVPLRFFERDQIRWSDNPPPSGWLLDQEQPVS